MKKKFLNIAATILSLSIATPFAMHADRQRESDTNIDPTYYDDNYSEYNQATELLTLDSEAIEELSHLGINVYGENDQLANHIIDYAAQHLGRPYRHGAKGPSAFDCSGFTSYVFKQYGIDLSASSRTQYTQGVKINTDEVRPGDLLFFGGRAGGKTVGHVGIAVDIDDDGTITFIHAANSSGITYNKYPDGGYYSRRYIGARRVIE